MANPTLDAIAGGASANSYVTRSVAQTYFDGRLDVDVWTVAGDSNKDRSLIMATNRLEQEEFAGVRTNIDVQRLKWPRTGITVDGVFQDPDDGIPRIIEEGAAELALHYLKNPTSAADSGLEGFENIKIDVVDITPKHSRKADALPQRVIDILDNVLINVAGSTGTRHVSRA